MHPLIPVLTLISFLAPALAAPGPSQVAPETHPVGDIPDSQAFVRYLSPAGGYSLEVPEGWARTVKGDRTVFNSKLGSVEIQSVPASTPPSAASLRAGPLAALARQDPSLKVSLVKDVTLPSGPAVLARFTSTGEANAVTGRRPALENDLYQVWGHGRLITLRLSGPQGSDNVDAWNRIARSLAWR